MPRRREIVPAGSSGLVWPTPQVGSTAPVHVSQISLLHEQKLVKGGFVPNLDMPKSKMHLFPRYVPAFS
jgi:hypothetical protein